MLDGKLRIAPTCYHVPHSHPGHVRPDVCAQDLVAEVYKELMEREDLREEYEKVAATAQSGATNNAATGTAGRRL
jgi:hypothetical protein